MEHCDTMMHYVAMAGIDTAMDSTAAAMDRYGPKSKIGDEMD